MSFLLTIVLWSFVAYCPHRNDYNLNSSQIKNVIVSVTIAKLVPLGIPRCNCNQRVFPRSCYISRESIRLGIKNVVVIVIIRKLIPEKNKKVACNNLFLAIIWGRLEMLELLGLLGLLGLPETQKLTFETQFLQ